jgi:hypothetical protein
VNKGYLQKFLDDSVRDTRKTPRLFEKGHCGSEGAAPRGRLRRSLKALHKSYGKDRVGPILLFMLGLPLLIVFAIVWGWKLCVLIGLIMLSVWIHRPKKHSRADRDQEV